MIFRFRFSTVCYWIAGMVVFALLIGLLANPSAMAGRNDDTSFAIVMYHHISPDVALTGEYVITPERLEEDFQYLKQRGYHTLTVRELYAIQNGEIQLPQKSILLTFDDGQESFYRYAYPLLKKYGFSAVFSIIGSYTELYSNGEDSGGEYAHVTWAQMKEMAASGLVEFGNHSYHLHSNNGIGRSGVTQMAGESEADYRAAITADIAEFNRLFENNMGFRPSIYTYPFGRFSDLTEQIVQENGFSAALTCYEERVVPKSSENWLFRLGRYNRSGKIKTEAFFKKLSVF